MYSKASSIVLATILVFGLLPAHAATEENKNPYVREGSIGKASTQTKIIAKPFTTVKVRDWVGHKVIFLPRSKSSQRYGYLSWRPADISMEDYVRSGQIGVPYSVLAGKTAQVIGVDSSEDSTATLTVRLDDGTEYICETGYSEEVDDLALLNDLAEAKRRFRGKPLWILTDTILTMNAQTEELGAVKVAKTSKVQVVDVVAGSFSHCPIRFIVKALSGKEGYVDVHISDTNVPEILREFDRFSDTFLTEDPRKTRKWSSKVWSAIEKGRVILGMTKEQAKFAWGAPKSINRTTTRGQSTEQWVYGIGTYLYLRNGIVTAIQD